MKFFADTSWLGNVYYPGGKFAAVAARIRKAGVAVVISTAVRLEFRLGSLWHAANESGWRDFLTDEASGVVRQEAIRWDDLFAGFENEVLRRGRTARPDLLDGLHVLSALQCGATHFLSFDENSRQRAFARACGLKLVPERLG